MGGTKVTVVIPAYNKARFIEKAIQSVLEQTLTDWYMIIADDASTDMTKAIIQTYMDKDLRIQSVYFNENLGISGVWKEVLPLIKTKYFIQLDGDDWLEKDALEMLLKKMESAKGKPAVAYGNLVRWTEDEDGKVIKKVKIYQRQIKDKYDFITYHKMFYPRFYRTKYVREVGGWTTDVPYGGRYSEDRQILLKLISTYSFLHVDRHLYNHRIHGNNNSGKHNLEMYAKVNRYLYEKALKDWGNKYKPIYMWKKGRLKVYKLKRVKPDG